MESQGGISFSYTTVQGFSLGSKTPGGRSNGTAKKPAAASSDTFSQFRALALQFGPKEALTSLVDENVRREPKSSTQDIANPHQHADGKQQREGKQQQEHGSQINGGDVQPAEAVQPPLLESSVEYFQVEAAEPNAAQAAAAAATTEAPSQEDIEALGRRPYWMARCSNIRSPFLRLHQEMVELSELLQPAPEEIENRRAAVQEIREVVNTIWPSARVEVFGSFATGLYVPTSDIDLVVMDSRCTNIQDGLKAIASALVRRQLATKIQVIGKARVPIIKFESTGYGGIAFDVSFDVANGPQAAELVREFVDMWPMMRPLVLVLKLFLQQRELNEVYTGGIGSYALITMVSAFLQLHISRRPRDTGNSTSSKAGGKKGASKKGQQQVKAQYLEPSLGVLLVDFFRFFGRIINMQQVGLSCADGGHFFNKIDKDWVNDERPFMLAVEDPKDPTNDICRSSYNIMRVKQAFDFAYQQLSAPCDSRESRLARILRLGPILVSRKPCPDPIRLYQALQDVRAVPRPPSEAVKSAGKSAASGATQTSQEVGREQQKQAGKQQDGGSQQGTSVAKGSEGDTVTAAGTKRGRTESPALEPPSKLQWQETPVASQGKQTPGQQQGKGQSRDAQQGQAQGSQPGSKPGESRKEQGTPAPSTPAAAPEEEGDDAEAQEQDEGEEDVMELAIIEGSGDEGGQEEEEDPSADVGGEGEEDEAEGESSEGEEDEEVADGEEAAGSGSREGSQPRAAPGQGLSRSARRRARKRQERMEQQQQQQQQQVTSAGAGDNAKQSGKRKRGAVRGSRAGRSVQAKKQAQQQQLGVQHKPMKGGGRGRKEPHT